MAYDPNKHLMNLKGKAYLPVAQRLVWFREEHPDWGIRTEAMALNPEEGLAIFHATITDPAGNIMAQATKMETVKGFGDFVEKAETGSVGRALAMCGYGTQFAPEFDEAERLADTPQPAARALPAAPRRVDTTVHAAQPGTPVGQAIAAQSGQAPAGSRPAALCVECGEELTAEQSAWFDTKGVPPRCKGHYSEWKQKQAQGS